MTSTQLNLNLSEARVNRDAGIQLAIDSAERKNPGWSAKAWEMFVAWLKPWAPGHKFTIEQFRFSAEIQGLEKPPSSRAYGHIAVRARKAGLVKAGEKVATSSPTAHKCFATQWIKN